MALRSTSARAVLDQLGIPAATLRKWVQRGLVAKLGWDRYAIDDVLAQWVHWRDERAKKSGGKHV